MRKPRRTPIEKAIDGDDRQSRYMARKAEAGLTRVAVWCPVDRLDDLKAVAQRMVAEQAKGGDE